MFLMVAGNGRQKVAENRTFNIEKHLRGLHSCRLKQEMAREVVAIYVTLLIFGHVDWSEPKSPNFPHLASMTNSMYVMVDFCFRFFDLRFYAQVSSYGHDGQLN